MKTLPTEATTADMADVLGIHPRTLQKLAKEGWIDGRLGHDRWDVLKTIRYYLTHVELTALAGKP